MHANLICIDVSQDLHPTVSSNQDIIRFISLPPTHNSTLELFSRPEHDLSCTLSLYRHAILNLSKNIFCTCTYLNYVHKTNKKWSGHQAIEIRHAC